MKCRIEPAPEGQTDVVDVETGLRRRAQSRTIAVVAAACLEAGEIFLAQLLLGSPIAEVIETKEAA